jgi:hypothetical protein
VTGSGCRLIHLELYRNCVERFAFAIADEPEPRNANPVPCFRDSRREEGDDSGIEREPKANRPGLTEKRNYWTSRAYRSPSKTRFTVRFCTIETRELPG